MKKMLLTLAVLLTFACTETKLPDKPLEASTYKEPTYNTKNSKESKLFMNKFYPKSWIDNVVDGQTKIYYNPKNYHKLGFFNDRGQTFLTNNPYYSKELPNGDVEIKMYYAMSSWCFRDFLFWEVIPEKEQEFWKPWSNTPLTRSSVRFSSILAKKYECAVLNPFWCDSYVIKKRYITLVDPWTEKKFLRNHPKCYKVWASSYLHLDKVGFVNNFVDQRHDPNDIDYRMKAIKSKENWVFLKCPRDPSEHPDYKI